MFQDGSVQTEDTALQLAGTADPYRAAHIGLPRKLTGHAVTLAQAVDGGEHAVWSAGAQQVGPF